MALRVPAVVVGEAVIPQLGLGTFQLRDQTCVDVVAEALRLGYRHLDTAQGYDNEAEVGAGLAAAGVPRDEVFVTTKVRPDRMTEGVLQRSVEESLKKLQLERIDLLLLHWPNPAVPLAESIGALNDVKRRGLVRHIGLSNFPSRLLAEATRLTREPLVTEQIEYHPFLDQSVMRAALRERGMALTAYCPLALGRVVGNPTIETIAARHGKTAAQVTLRWLVQQPQVVAIPKTAHPRRLSENLAVFDFALTDAEMAEIGGLAAPGSRLINEPQWVPEWDS